MESNIAIRLKHFFEYANLTSSQFADTCGIARPTLSQILTGRNKKISDILIGQIHNAYPRLSILWLLFGEGDMMIDASPGTPQYDSEGELSVEDSSGLLQEGAEITVNDHFPNHNAPTSQDVKHHDSTPLPRVEIISQPPVIRKISHITVYYDDSTFETFYPKR